VEATDFSGAYGLYQQGGFAASLAASRGLLSLEPAAGQTVHLLALAAHQLGRNQEAELWLRRALLLLADGDLVDALVNRGSVLSILGRNREALASAARALAHAPGKARALCVRAAVLRAELAPIAAVGAARQATALEPALVEAWTTLANALQAAGRAAEAVAMYARAIALAPDDILAHGNRLFTLSFAAGTDDRRLYEAARAWAARLEAIWPPLPMARPQVAGRRIRIGYHSFEFFLRSLLDEYFPPVLRHHDRNRFEIVLLADGGRRDARTEELRGLADGFVELEGLDLAGKVERMRSCELDIAVCLTGYLPIHRVVFARRVAPIQVAQMNHVGTTGLRAFDYRITDRWLDPPGESEGWNTERLVRLDRGYVPVAPPEPAPAVSAAPAHANGHVTFGSFNNVAKITPATLALWSRVLAATPGSRLMVKARALEDAALRHTFAATMAECGIAAARVDFLGAVAGHDQHMTALARADIGLDPVPFAGGRSTIEALWMGVPIVNLKSPGLVGRLGASLLCRADLEELVCTSAEEYVAKAAGLAADLPRLDRLRAGMRARLERSVLCDAKGYTRELEAAFGAMTRGDI
jgi:predicted O-linked N-acetylglucosamine transferase (SPINDLY family)